MATSKEVFALRKEKKLDEAYQMALELGEFDTLDIWELRALAWCLIDLIKRDAKEHQYNTLPDYSKKLSAIQVSIEEDDILFKQKEYALSICNPSQRLLMQARAYSKEENYAEAIKCYSRIQTIPEESSTNYGWALYREIKRLQAQGAYTLPAVKGHLYTYTKLSKTNPSIGPSILHSCMLRIANQLAKEGHLNIASFYILWGINSYRSEDTERTSNQQGTVFPALMEEVIRRACNAALKSKNIKQVETFAPLLDNFITQYPDNIWLIYTKAKMLIFLGDEQKAQKYCRTVCKAKNTEFWAWGLLGDAYGNNLEAKLNCYAKGILCPKEEGFDIKLRCKIAKLLAECNYFPQAKHEIIAYRQAKQDKKEPDIELLCSQDWFSETTPTESNKPFYKERAAEANKLLLDDIPWLDAVMGDTFTREKEGKTTTRRKIYIKTTKEPLEVTISEKLFAFRKLPLGSALHIKGEQAPAKPYQIFLIEQREHAALWNIFESHIGIISFVNKQNQTYRVLVAPKIDVVFDFNKLQTKAKEGDFVEVRIASYQSKGALSPRYNAVTVSPTSSEPKDSIYKRFSNEIINIRNGFGFTFTDIFIPPNLVDEASLQDLDEVSGSAILSYDKKKDRWGWKALSVQRTS